MTSAAPSLGHGHRYKTVRGVTQLSLTQADTGQKQTDWESLATLPPSTSEPERGEALCLSFLTPLFSKTGSQRGVLILPWPKLGGADVTVRSLAWFINRTQADMATTWLGLLSMRPHGGIANVWICVCVYTVHTHASGGRSGPGVTHGCGPYKL